MNITVDGRPPRYPETFVNDMDGDGVPEFIAFPGDVSEERCRPLLIALSTVRENDNIDSSDTRYITVAGADGSVDNYCKDLESFETVGDMDGDGFDEFVLYSQGTHVLQGLHNTSGEIRLADLDGSNGFLVEGAISSGSVGDLDGDGLDELALTRIDPDLYNLGTNYIVRGRAGPRKIIIDPESDTDDDLLTTLLTGPDNNSLVLPLGDVNGDAIDDILVKQSDNLNIVYGAVDLRIPDNLLADPASSVIGKNCGGFYTCPVLTDFDFDADGFNDIAITFGIPERNPTAIVYGGPDGLPVAKVLADLPKERFTILTGTPYLAAESSPTFADTNGDGVKDIYFRSSYGTTVLLATPGRRLAEINIDSLDGSNGYSLTNGYTQVSSTFRSFTNGRVRMADMNGDGYSDYLDGQIMVEGLDDAPVGRVPMGILVRQGPESADFFWHVLDNAQDVDGFRISAGGTVLASLPVTASSYRVMFDSREQSRDVRISAIDASGLEIGASVRRIQAYGQGFEMRVAVYGPNLLELIWDSPAVDFLVWRDGEVYQPGSGHSFLDTDVSPGVIHEYFVTLDVLTGRERNAEYLNSLEGQQRRSNAVTIGPRDTSTPVDPGGPVILGGMGLRPDIPVDLSGIVYSSTALETFWSPVINVSIGRYDEYRNGSFVASVPGNSWFDDTLVPATTYRYPVVAVSSTGLGSIASRTLELTTASDGSGNHLAIAPSGLRGSVYSSTALELFWDSDPSRSQRYIVLANGVEVGRRAGASLFIEGLNPGTRYDFTVQPADPDTAAQTAAARISLTTRQ